MKLLLFSPNLLCYFTSYRMLFGPVFGSESEVGFALHPCFCLAWVKITISYKKYYKMIEWTGRVFGLYQLSSNLISSSAPPTFSSLKLPFCIITWLASFLLPSCIFSIFSSIDFFMMNLYTLTSLVCPIRCTLPIAWSSCEGFHQGSQIMTLFAFAKFKPVAPARIEIIRNLTLSFYLNLFIAFCLFYTVIPPTTVSNYISRRRSFYSKIEIILIHCVKITHFYPLS